MDTLIVFLGYVLVTTGFFLFYLMLFRKDRLPPIFTKWWFNMVMMVASIAMVVLGWLMATRVI